LIFVAVSLCNARSEAVIDGATGGFSDIVLNQTRIDRPEGWPVSVRARLLQVDVARSDDLRSVVAKVIQRNTEVARYFALEAEAELLAVRIDAVRCGTQDDRRCNSLSQSEHADIGLGQRALAEQVFVDIPDIFRRGVNAQCRQS